MSSKIDVQGKVAVVTGASSGIGLEFSRRLAERGCDIVMISNVEEDLQRESKALSEQYRIKTYILHLDLTQPDVVERIDEFMQRERLEAYLLINNAGIFSFLPVTDTPQGKIECFVDLHVRAVTLLSRFFGDKMKQRGEGYILNMSSMSCWMPMPGIAMYSATKAYIRVFTRALHYELRDSGVRVMVACPGGIATTLFGLPENLKRFAVGIGVLATPEGFTRKAVVRLLKGRKQYINGLLNRFSIFFIATLPTWARMLVKRKLLDRGITR